MSEPDDALRGLSPEDLAVLDTAGREVVRLQRVLRKNGRGVIGALLPRAAEPGEWTHYPQGDAFDPATGAQYYYHVHPPEDRAAGEHGHFHLFMRERGMPPGHAPVPGQDLAAGDDTATSHLFAISMDGSGNATRLFTVNRWVTGDAWYAAADVKRMIEAFRIGTVRPSLAVNRWICAMAALFRPQIFALVDARDRAVDARRRACPGTDVFEDRDLEVTSAVDVSVERQVGLVRRMVDDARGA